MSFQEHITRDRRLVILRLLRQAPGYSANDSLIDHGLGHLGHHVSRDVVRGDLSWLEEPGLVATSPAGPVVVAKLTIRGEDVATGEATHPGVKRPGPGD